MGRVQGTVINFYFNERGARGSVVTYTGSAFDWP